MDFTVANAVADMGAALLSMCRFPRYTVRLNEQELTKGNTRFFSLRELAPE